MAFRRDCSIREAYEEIFSARAVPYQRTVRFVGRRPAFSQPEEDYDREGEYDGQRYSGPRGYRGDDQRAFHGDGVHFENELRKGPPYRREEQYPYYRGPREGSQSTRHVEFRNSNRPATSQPNIRGQKLPPPRLMSSTMPNGGDDTLMQAILNLDRADEHEGLRRKGPLTPMRERSPVKRDVAASRHTRSGSSTSSRSYSPDRSKSYPNQGQPRKRFEDPYCPERESDMERPSSYKASASCDSSPHSSVSASKEDQDSIAKERPSKVLDDYPERRAQAIAAKALEIEKLYRQDCETFGMVVKMLVSKDPGLEKQLQAPLKENLNELRERCLEGLRQFVTELDDMMLRPESST
ncbi:periphilin-1 [Denticeps clupeoides]|uniref:Periphilin-1 C-terminal domain-containing protein n=1 Tax=Denticeps clupeoides TaxID=299321 RepID=A0AAY4EB27_9TELE|nr:periphilin-1-like [Denticeps clupeoides]